jgi:hypothetical protein
MARQFAKAEEERVRRSAFFFITAPLALLYGCAQIAGLDDFVDEQVSAQSASAASSSSSQGAGGATGSGGGSSHGSVGGGGGAGGNGSGGGSGGCDPIGGVVPIVCGQGQPTAIAASLDGVFWADELKGEIIKFTNVGSLIRIVDAEMQPCGVAVRGEYIYFRTRGGYVKRKSLVGGALDVIASGQGDSCAIDADDQLVYWFKIAGGTSELVKGKVGAAPTVLAQGQKPTRLTAADAMYVYWIDLLAGKLFHADKTNGGGLAITRGRARYATSPTRKGTPIQRTR